MNSTSIVFFSIPVFFVLNFYAVRRLRVCWFLLKNSKREQRKVILTKEKYLANQLLKEFVVWIVYCIVTCFMFCFTTCTDCFTKNQPMLPFYNLFTLVDKTFLDLVQRILLISLSTFLIWIGILSVKTPTETEISYLSSVNNLTLGYGAAIWYYKNYLDRILPDNFLMRVEQYKNMEGVQLPYKLYILFPKSCKVEKYIDHTEYIEFSKDLPPYKIDHGGIAGREYNISVYRIKYNGKFFRCALEYAQPLKTLLAFKEKGRISLEQMDVERESFIQELTLMLKDNKNSFKVCELVEYDDRTDKLHEILSGLPSVQEYKCKTIE